jgi:hypothetical protein
MVLPDLNFTPPEEDDVHMPEEDDVHMPEEVDIHVSEEEHEGEHEGEHEIEHEGKPWLPVHNSMVNFKRLINTVLFNQLENFLLDKNMARNCDQENIMKQST